MNTLSLAQSLVNFEKRSPLELQRHLEADLTLLSRSFGHLREYPPARIESVSRTLGQMQTESASVEALRLQYIQLTESGNFVEAALKIESALRLSPDNIDVALKFQSILVKLWGSFHELAVKEPTNPSLAFIFTFLHDRGYLGIEGYLFAANHFFRTAQLERARRIVAVLRKLMPNLNLLSELETINDHTEQRPAARAPSDQSVEILPGEVANAVAAATNLEMLLHDNQYQMILTETQKTADHGVIDKLTAHAFYMRAISLSSLGRLDESLNLIVQLRQFSPYRIEYLNSQNIICRQLNDRLCDRLPDPQAKFEDILHMSKSIRKHGSLNQGASLLLAEWFTAKDEYKLALDILDPQFELMPNDPDVLNAIMKLPEYPAFRDLKVGAKMHLKTCRRLRPFDFRYWSDMLAHVMEA